MEEIILCQPIKPKRIRVYANCEHDKKKRNCKVCSPQNYCEHNREKYQCKECGGGSICEHGKKKSICKKQVKFKQKLNRKIIFELFRIT